MDTINMNDLQLRQLNIDQNIRCHKFLSSSIKIKEDFIRNIKYYNRKIFICSNEKTYIINEDLKPSIKVIKSSSLEQKGLQFTMAQLAKHNLNIISFAIEEQKLCALFEDDVVAIFDMKDLHKIKEIDCRAGSEEDDFAEETHFLRIQDGKLGIAVTNVLSIVNLKNNNYIGAFVEQVDYITCFQIDDKQLYIGGVKNDCPHLTVWDLENRKKDEKLFENFHQIQHHISSMQICEGKLFCEFTNYSDYGCIAIWDLKTFQQLGVITEKGCISCFHYENGKLFSVLSTDDISDKTLLCRNFNLSGQKEKTI